MTSSAAMSWAWMCAASTSFGLTVSGASPFCCRAALTASTIASSSAVSIVVPTIGGVVGVGVGVGVGRGRRSRSGRGVGVGVGAGVGVGRRFRSVGPRRGGIDLERGVPGPAAVDDDVLAGDLADHDLADVRRAERRRPLRRRSIPVTPRRLAVARTSITIGAEGERPGDREDAVAQLGRDAGRQQLSGVETLRRPAGSVASFATQALLPRGGPRPARGRSSSRPG